MSETSNERRSGSLLLPAIVLAVAAAAALLLVLAGCGTRIGLWSFHTGFTLLKYGACGGAGAALLALFAGIVSLRKRQARGIIISLAALACGMATTAVPVSWRVKASRLPLIHDITTDTVHPPQFVAILPLRGGAPNPAEYGGPEVAEQQKNGYPDLRTEVLDIPSGQAFDRALAAARAMGWRIVVADPVQGRIEASDTTFWFGFVDDIVIRTAPAGERTLVDVRSVSRVGKSDVGTNAQRIRRYLQRLRG
jgi:hypothetical protein